MQTYVPTYTDFIFLLCTIIDLQFFPLDVWYITPNYGSYAGGTLVSLIGRGWSLLFTIVCIITVTV